MTRLNYRERLHSAWTIQPIEVWSALVKRTSLTVDPAKVTPHFPDIPLPYSWLASQLPMRNDGFSGKLPWWVYASRPDLRKYRHLVARGPQARIELVTDKTFCFFPLWAWEKVLTGTYLSAYEGVEEQFYTELESAGLSETWPLPQPWLDRLMDSWNDLFNPDLPLNGGLVGVVEELRLRSVLKVKTFGLGMKAKILVKTSL